MLTDEPEEGGMHAIRGAIRVQRNTRDAIVRGTQRLLREILDRNELGEEDVVSAFFTMTPDLDADFPAHAVRRMGWTSTAMLGAQETPVPGAMDRMVRVLLHVRAEGPPRHVYLGEAAAMRPDLAEGEGAPGGEGRAVAPRPPDPSPVDAADGSAAGPDLGTLLVVGLGLVGGSAALALRGGRLFSRVIGHDRDPRALETARRRGAVDATVGPGPGRADRDGDDLDEALARADVVLLALPVDAIAAWLERRGPRLSPGTVVLDVGSTKRETVRALGSLPDGVEAVGTHPMAGSTRTGMGAARPDLFGEAPWALVETARTGDRAREVAEAVVRAAGGRPLWTEPGAHDRAAAATSHVPYLLAATLARHLWGRSDDAPVARLLGPGAADMTRLAGSDPRMMAGILSTNWPAIRTEVEQFRRRLEEAVDELDARRDDPAALQEALATAARAREGLFGGRASDGD